MRWAGSIRGLASLKKGRTSLRLRCVFCGDAALGQNSPAGVVVRGRGQRVRHADGARRGGRGRLTLDGGLVLSVLVHCRYLKKDRGFVRETSGTCTKQIRESCVF